MVGRTISHYRALRRLGGGGMGVVYEAEDLRLHRHVALKFLPDAAAADRVALRRLEREAQLASALNHPNICTVFDIDVEGGTAFIVMELVKGRTLKEVIGAGPLPLDIVLEVALQVADALEAAHSAGIVHRDIKPANVILTERGQVKVLDFGLAKTCAASAAEETKTAITAPGDAVGTLSYMSPEQVNGADLDARTDLFSLGVMLYEMCTGIPPFRGPTAGALAHSILSDTPAPAARLRPDLPVELDQIISKCLEKNRDLRYQSASEIRTDLKRLLRERSAGGGTAPEHDEPKAPRRGSAWRWLAGGVLVALLGGGWLWYSRRPAPIPPRSPVVVADFENATGDPVFDETLKQALAVQLAQSPFLNVLSDRKVQGMLRLMGHGPSDRLTAALAQDVCRRAGGKATLGGSIAALGTHYVLALNAENCATGDSLAREEVEASRKEDVLKQLDQAVARLRRTLGESLASVRQFDTPVEQATTSSLEALQAYSRGARARWEDNDEEAIPFFERALQLDPGFAMANLYLAISYANLGERETAVPYARKAYSLRDRVSERERCNISGDYHFFVTRDIDQQIAAWGACERAYPDDFVPHLALGIAYENLGQYEKAIAEMRRALQAEPTNGNCYGNLMSYLMATDRLPEAKAVYQQAARRGIDNFPVHLNRYGIAFLEGDEGEMQRQLAWGAGRPGVEDAFLSDQADTEGFSGHLATARDLTRRAVESARLAGKHEAAAEWELAEGWREAEYGNAARARKDVAAALALAATRDVQVLAALVLARTGRVAEALVMADRLGRAYPSDTLLNAYWLPCIRAAVDLGRGHAAGALDLLQSAAPYGLSSAPPFGNLCPLYLRGEAYRQAGEGGRAAAEFQKVLEHRGIIQNAALGAAAQLGLARARAQQGDAAGARAAFERFFALWKDADPDIPLLRAAKAEYARLK